MKSTFLCILALASAFLWTPAAHAQTGGNYDLSWFTIDGGGGTSTGGVYSVSGTIGQPDAGGPMSGGNYSLTGGFWSLISVVQAAGLPNLRITHSGNSVVVSWPDTGSYTLQQNTNVAALAIRSPLAPARTASPSRRPRGAYSSV